MESKYGELAECIDSTHTEVDDLSSRYINGSDPSHTIYRRTANIPGPASLDEIICDYTVPIRIYWLKECLK